MRLTKEQRRLADDWWKANKNTPEGKRIQAVCDRMEKFMQQAFK